MRAVPSPAPRACPPSKTVSTFSSLVKFLEQRLDSPAAPAAPAEGGLRLAVAALLVEMARADFQADAGELEQVRTALTERYDLGADEVAALMAAAEREADQAVSLFRFTRLINERLAPADKLELIRMLWEVAYADGRLDKHEDALMHKLGDLMYVPLVDLMRLKDGVLRKMRERQ